MRDDSERSGPARAGDKSQSSPSVRSRWFSCQKWLVLLGEGTRVSLPTCCCCGRVFPDPRRNRKKFRFQRRLIQTGAGLPSPYRRETVCVGTEVPAATVASKWPSLVGGSTIFVGEKVLIATIAAPDGKWRRYMMCETCGENVLAKTGAMNPYYVWDWLAEIRPRWFRRLARQFSD